MIMHFSITTYHQICIFSCMEPLKWKGQPNNPTIDGTCTLYWNFVAVHRYLVRCCKKAPCSIMWRKKGKMYYLFLHFFGFFYWSRFSHTVEAYLLSFFVYHLCIFTAAGRANKTASVRAMMWDFGKNVCWVKKLTNFLWQNQLTLTVQAHLLYASGRVAKLDYGMFTCWWFIFTILARPESTPVQAHLLFFIEISLPIFTTVGGTADRVAKLDYDLLTYWLIVFTIMLTAESISCVSFSVDVFCPFSW